MTQKILLTIFTLLILSTTQAQTDGTPDTSFGTNGSIITNIGILDFNVRSQAIQPDGKRVLVGERFDFNQQRAFITRLNPDGTLDTSFGINGKCVYDFTMLNRVLIQTDGKIIATGTKIIRLNTNGTTDTSFGSNGFINLVSEVLLDVCLQNDGKFITLSRIISNATTGNDPKVTRYNSSGTIDNTFGNNGVVITHMELYDYPKSIALQNDGKIVIGGTNVHSSGLLYRFFLIRYTNNGSLDTTFNSTGKWTLSTAFDSQFFGLAIQSDGKILFTGKRDGQLTMTRVNPNGVHDSGFQFAAASSNTYTGGIKISNGGKIIISDHVFDSEGKRFITFRRFDSAGNLDATFGENGLTTLIYFTNSSIATDFSVIGEKILLTGNTYNDISNNNIVTATLNDNGSFDMSYSEDGKATLFFGENGSDQMTKIIQQPDGKILSGGSSNLTNSPKATIFRYNENGIPDTSFANGSGKVIISHSAGMAAMALDTSGKIVVALDTSSMPVYKLNNDGSIDTGFGNQGYVSFNWQSTGVMGYVFTIATQQDNKIILGGTNSDGSFVLYRRNADGSLDTTFGANGNAILPNLSQSLKKITALKLQNDGKILATGYVANSSHTEFDTILLRINPNGTIDTSFNGNGYLIYSPGTINIPTNIDVQNDGKIVLSGCFNQGSPGLIRITSTGLLDSTFASNGLLQTGFGPNSTEIISSSNYYAPIINKILVKVLDNQKLLISCTTKQNEDYLFAMAKYNSNGTLDNSFGNNGLIVLPEFLPETKKLSSAETIVTNESVFMAGDITYTDNTKDFIVAKYHIENSMGIDDSKLKNVLFYPNPVIDRLIFGISVISVTIYDMNGKQIQSRFENNEMNLSKLKSGVYLINITTEDGKSTSQKLVKK